VASRLFEVGGFNGMSFGENLDQGNLVRLRNPTDYGTFMAAHELLYEFSPHIVIDMVGRDFAGSVFPLIETTDPPERQLDGGTEAVEKLKPFYLLSPDQKSNDTMLGLVTSSFAEQRIMGLNFAAAEDSTLYDEYLVRLKDTFGNGAN
jgi:hypothetical protein